MTLETWNKSAIIIVCNVSVSEVSMSLHGISNNWVEDAKLAMQLLKDGPPWKLGLNIWFLLSYCCCRIDCHCHCCWLTGADFTGLGLRTAKSTFPFIEHMGFSDMKEWDNHMTLILRSWASQQVLPVCLGSMDTHVNMFWDTNDNMLQSSSSSFSNQVHAFNALCTASSKGWASVP